MVFGLFSIKQRLKQYLDKKGVRPLDVPKVLIVFKACYFATWMLVIPLCARYHPLTRFFKLSGPRRFKIRMINRFPKQYAWLHKHTLHASRRFGDLKVIRWIPESLGQRRKDFGIATAEAYVLIHLLYPVWGSVEFMFIVRYFQRKQSDFSLEEISDSYEQSWRLSLFEWMKGDWIQDDWIKGDWIKDDSDQNDENTENNESDQKK